MRTTAPKLAWIWPVAGALLLLVGLAAQAQQPESAADLQARIEKLIRQLDDDSFAAREQAERDLETIGEAAMPKLTAALKDDSAERRLRADKLLQALKRAGLGLRHLSTIKHPFLQGAVTLTLSPDGKFVYVPAFQASAVNVFRRDAATGALEQVQGFADPEQLGGVVALRLSADGKLAVASAFSAKSIALFSRDEASGELSLEAVRRHEPAGALKMEWPIDAAFSIDGKFVYAVDDRAATVLVFQVGDDKRLNLVQTFAGEDRCFDGARGVAAHPDGKTIYVNSRRPGTLAVLDRDPKAGTLAVRQLIRDGQGGVQGLAGTTGACVSRDGKFVYTISGRFEGDHAVGVYRVGEDGKLTMLQEHINDQGELKNLTGPNELAISPDGLHLYASGTTSCSLACFQRDPATGKLTCLATVQNEGTGVGVELGANGVDVSPDGRFLYLALENASGISIFERTPRRP
jgi:6-phosphogluconolactonase (cycloisomerase 2 family)